MVMAGLFIIAKKHKQPKYPTTDEWIHKIWRIHTMEYYFTIERTEVIDTCNNIDKH